jgi:serine/threonine-protein kinase
MSSLLAGRYEVGELVARGGMANVYRGHDQQLDRPVAIKMLGPHLGSDERASRRLRREARVAASLGHPNIVRVLDVIGPEHGAQAIVLEELPGLTLADQIWDDGPLSFDRLLHVVRAVVSGLEAAHAEGLIHRDIKTSNILLTPDGDPKIADFGIAQGPNLTTTTTVHGSIHYMAPEQALGAKSDARTDLYSLGCVLYEMLTGSTPFSGTTAEIIEQHLASEPRPVQQLRANVPDGLSELSMRLLRKNPDERPESAAKVGEALDRLMGEPDAAISDLLPPLQEAEYDPMRALTPEAAVARISGMTPDRRGDTSRMPAGEAPPTAPTGGPPRWVGIAVAAVVIAALALFVLPRLFGPVDAPGTGPLEMQTASDRIGTPAP